MNISSTILSQEGDNELKIVVIGESSVGKTSIINQYINELFIDQSISTIGTDKFTKIETINNKEIKLNIWDTAGQERFRSLTPLFLKGSNIVLMVYDITDKVSFVELNNFWLQKVKDNTNNIILGIIANKSDLYINEAISIDEGKQFAKSVNGFLFETSAKNLESVRNAFISLVQIYIEKNGGENSSKEHIQIQKANLKKKKKNVVKILFLFHFILFKFFLF